MSPLVVSEPSDWIAGQAHGRLGSLAEVRIATASASRRLKSSRLISASASRSGATLLKMRCVSTTATRTSSATRRWAASVARLGKRARPSGGAVALAAALRLRRSRACDVKVHMLRYKDTGRSPRCHGRVINVRNRRRRRVRRIGRVKGASAERCKAVTVEVYPFVPSCRPAIIVDKHPTTADPHHCRFEPLVHGVFDIEPLAGKKRRRPAVCGFMSSVGLRVSTLTVPKSPASWRPRGDQHTCLTRGHSCERPAEPQARRRNSDSSLKGIFVRCLPV
mmetsp:Transcript_28327/g.96497  ORF Transcript_28327/g.96497 Transcript_28327/m.96497 type:complete len:278 (+) Transcript_28327:1094-1927(+)